MTTFRDILDSELAPDAPITSDLGYRWRDNPSMVEIAEVVISNDATIEFTDFDASLFEDYHFKFRNVVPATNGVAINLRTSANSGISYDSGANDYNNGSSGDLSYLGLTQNSTNVSNVANIGFSSELIIFGPSRSVHTMIASKGMYYDYTFFWLKQSDSEGFRDSAAAVNAVQVYASTGNLSTGTITMYGIKK